MPVVSNSSPLIALQRIQRLDLVPTILQSVLIPPAVAREIAPSIPVLPHWVSVQAPTKPPSGLTSRGRLGDGEWEAIALAVELGGGAILIDDRPARRLAEAAGLHVIGTLAVLLEAKRAGHVRTSRAELDKLLETSFFLSPQLYDLAEVLVIVGQHTQARSHLQRAIRLGPDDPSIAYYHLALIARARGQYADAPISLDAAIRHSPKYPLALVARRDVREAMKMSGSR